MPTRFCIAENRAIVRVSGADARSFLQGIVSNDVDKVAPNRAVWAAFLTPQGKYLHDFFIVELDGELLLDCEAARREDLVTRLSRYRLRSKVKIVADDGYRVVLAWDGAAVTSFGLSGEPGNAAPLGDGISFVDPRLADAGVRAILPASTAEEEMRSRGLESENFEAWDRHRLSLGLPDGSRDMEVDKTVLLEAGFHELSGVDWGKGCYMGQELTARTFYRGLLKRRLFPIDLDGSAEPGTPILQGGKEVGVLRSVADGQAIALLRLDAVEDETAAMTAGEATVRPRKPSWMILKPKGTEG